MYNVLYIYYLIYIIPVAAGYHQLPLDLVWLHQRRSLKVHDGLLCHLELYEVRAQPVDDLQVGGEVLVGVEVVGVGLLLVALVIEYGPDLLQYARVCRDQT